MQRPIYQQSETSSLSSKEQHCSCTDAICLPMTVAMGGDGGLKNKRLRDFYTKMLFTFNSHIQLHYNMSSQSIRIHLQQLIKKRH